jgi:3-deoxy-D-manno-octulosonic acid kinase
VVRALPILSRLPADFAVREGTDGVLVARADLADAFERAGFGPDGRFDLPASTMSGRRPLGELELGSTSYLVRRFVHGGLLRWLTGSRYLDAERPFRELLVAAELVERGIPTPLVVAARAQRASGGGWRLDVVTPRVWGTMDVGEALERVRRGEVGRRACAALFSAVGALVRRLHDAGLAHADLQPRNVLVNRGALTGTRPELWIVDLDRSFLVPELTDAERQTNLRRLLRAILRRESRGSPFLRPPDFARFLRGYDPERARWKDDWRAIAAARARLRREPRGPRRRGARRLRAQLERRHPGAGTSLLSAGLGATDASSFVVHPRTAHRAASRGRSTPLSSPRAARAGGRRKPRARGTSS